MSHGLHCPSPWPCTLLCLWCLGESAGAEGGQKHPKGPEARCCLVLRGFRSFLGCLGLASLSYSPKEVFPVPTAVFIVLHLKHGCRFNWAGRAHRAAPAAARPSPCPSQQGHIKAGFVSQQWIDDNVSIWYLPCQNNWTGNHSPHVYCCRNAKLNYCGLEQRGVFLFLSPASSS